MNKTHQQKTKDLIQMYLQKHVVLIQLLHVQLSYTRIMHCREVAHICVYLALKHSSDTEHAFLAGIAHDICREYKHEKLYSMVLLSGMSMSDKEKQHKILLHAKAAVVFLEQYYKLPKPVYNAIKTHTLGDSMYTDLQKIVYASDALDKNRKIWSSPKNKQLRTNILQMSSLNAMCVKIKKKLQEYYC